VLRAHERRLKARVRFGRGDAARLKKCPGATSQKGELTCRPEQKIALE
jgi:hypothetical protein